MSVAPTINQPGSGRARLIGVLGLLSFFAPLATDMYLPAFGRMAADFGADQGQMEWTLSAFFLGLALSQPFYGPLIDRFGRRGPLLVGVLLYVLASAGCCLTRDSELFIGFRLLQAVGGAAGLIIGRVIIHDLYGADRSARPLALLMMLMTMAPIVAPPLGAMVLLVADWPWIFVFMLAFGLICLFLTWRCVPETLSSEQRTPLQPGRIVRTYANLLLRPAFVAPALIVGLAQARMFASITGSPSLFMEQLSLGEQAYGWLFALNALGLIAFSQVNRILLRRWSPQRILGLGLGVGVIAAALLVPAAHTRSLVLVLPPLWLTIAALGLTTSNAAAIAMASAGRTAGSASALIGAMQFGLGFLASSAVAISGRGAMPTIILLVSLAACGLWFWHLRAAARG